MVRPVRAEDRDWIRRFITERWNAEVVAVHGVIYRPHELPGFVAEQAGEPVGLLTYQVAGDACEIITLDSTRPGDGRWDRLDRSRERGGPRGRPGVGPALIEAGREAAHAAGCRRLWLVTTNDNLEALRFYQKRGFVLAAVYRNAVAAARRLKPEISRTGAHGIPIRDEIELELLLD